MPYKIVEIIPERKGKWNWRIKDNLNFVLFKWGFEHIFTSVQEEHEDFLAIKFENSNQVRNFSAKILYEEKTKEPIENLVTLQFNKLELIDPLLNTMRLVFIDLLRKDYRKFLDNVYILLQKEEKRLNILEDCYWTDFSVVKFPKRE